MRVSKSVSPPAMRMPTRVDTGRGRKIGAGSRIASAKENTAAYERINTMGMNEEEREKLRQEMRARFQPEGRTIVPGTINGIASLANKRIEDAIARGQFKNLPRGKKIERDYSASSPFIDTTEYFMNKIIQRQEIVVSTSLHCSNSCLLTQTAATVDREATGIGQHCQQIPSKAAERLEETCFTINCK